jgi:predicted GTPase
VADATPLLPQDRQIAELRWRGGVPVVVIANKSDNLRYAQRRSSLSHCVGRAVSGARPRDRDVGLVL